MGVALLAWMLLLLPRLGVEDNNWISLRGKTSLCRRISIRRPDLSPCFTKDESFLCKKSHERVPNSNTHLRSWWPFPRHSRAEENREEKEIKTMHMNGF